MSIKSVFLLSFFLKDPVDQSQTQVFHLASSQHVPVPAFEKRVSHTRWYGWYVQEDGMVCTSRGVEGTLGAELIRAKHGPTWQVDAADGR